MTVLRRYILNILIFNEKNLIFFLIMLHTRISYLQFYRPCYPPDILKNKYLIFSVAHGYYLAKYGRQIVTISPFLLAEYLMKNERLQNNSIE